MRECWLEGRARGRTWGCTWSQFLRRSYASLPSLDFLLYCRRLLGEQWKAAEPSSTVYGETRSTDRHEALAESGMEPTLRGSRTVKCDNVVFCAAPSGNDDYAGEVAAAASEVWTGRGVFVFTSSAGVYAENEGGEVVEDSELGSNPRSIRLQEAEKACMDANGNVVRLSGLYSLERGPHNYWIEKGEVDANPHGLLNLISYEDAAGIVVAALKHGGSKNIYLAHDNVPITRLQICEATLTNSRYASKKVPTFTSSGPIDGKILKGQRTREALGWEPRYSSFAEFMAR
ncbi:unnamed protein product [Chrysoparadoxa australica]